MLSDRPLPEPIGADSCRLSERWVLDLMLAEMLVNLNGFFEQSFTSSGLRWPGIWIQSGFRTPAHQATLDSPATSSLHTRCPAMAADLRLGGLHARITAPETWAALGGKWKLMGGRWGGDFKDDQHPGPGVNLREMNHFALFRL